MAISERRFFVAASALVGAGIVAAAVRSTGFHWHDDYLHLTISRLALRDPHWLLDVWGRPVMTLAYMPAAAAGVWLARVTSLAFLAATAALAAGAARADRAGFAAAAALFLLAQPYAALLGCSVLPGTVFSLVFAAALWLRAAGRPAQAALVASLLPLARVEGVVVLAVWGLVLLKERRPRAAALLAAGSLAWAAAAAVASGDPLWLYDHNPYGILGSPYPAAGWTYVAVALVLAAGPVVAGLALLAAWRPRALDPIAGLSGAALAIFYAFAWGLPAFRSFRTPVYLVSISVPVALAARAGLLRLSGWRGGAWLWRGAAAAAVVVALLTIRPVPIDPPAALARDAVAALGARRAHVVSWSDPAFGWYAGLLPDARWGDPPPMSWRPLDALRPGDLVAWDSLFGPHELGTTEADLERRGFRRLWRETRQWAAVSVWVRE